MANLYSQTRPQINSILCSTSRYASTSTSAASGSSRRRRAPINTDGVDLVAPPDPASNIRPIIYASTPPRRRSTNSPYSAAEFPTSKGDSKLEGLELEWRFQRERVDAMNHRFWSTMNANFEAQLARRISLLPPASDPPSELDIKRKEDCLTQFYADWQVANRQKQGQWVREWWREVWAGLRMQGKVYWARGWSSR